MFVIVAFPGHTHFVFVFKQDVLIATDQEDHYMRFYDVTGINTEVVNKEHSLTELFQAVCMYSNITQPIEGEGECMLSIKTASTNSVEPDLGYTSRFYFNSKSSYLF